MGNYNIGSKVFGNWTIRRKIGEGSFGKVFEVQREDFGEVYKAALKIITVPQNEAELQGAIEEGMTAAQAEAYFYSMVESIVKEFAIMSKLKGTGNVVNYEDHTVIKHKDGIGWDILIRMELLNPLLPYAYDHPFSRREVIKLGIDICKALELCQKYNIIHRDIKPENIFVSDNGDFKLGDFGIARTIEKTMSGLSKKGTYNYMAPEVYRGHEYGFTVDTYSLGIVLYRLLNKNRVPFLPLPPTPITFNSKETSLAKRMSGEEIPKAFYAEGRLSEIVLKACAFNPKDRYSTPAQLRQELEAILYDQEESELIYPDGDELALIENQYASRTPSKSSDILDNIQDDEDATESFFSGDTSKSDGTVGVFSSDTDEDKTESILGSGSPQKPVIEKKANKNSTKLIILSSIGVVVIAAGILGGVYFSNQKKQEAEIAKQEKYQSLMVEGDKLCNEDPAVAMKKYLEAQGMYPEIPDSFISYAYAMYLNAEYENCITYIEDNLGLGKSYSIENQSKLSEILGACYFELDDYAEAAAFFRLSTAGGDITVDAMRDFAVSLGRIGDVEAANEVIERMKSAGASGDMNDYVNGEVKYASEKYVEAEGLFKKVLENSEDRTLQKRALRSLGDLYRDCAQLARSDRSPISYPATRSAEILSTYINEFGLRHDTVLWEMLAMAYFESFNTDPGAPPEYLNRAGHCFELVIEEGVNKDYLYTNLYTIYFKQGDFEAAEDALKRYSENFSKDYTPYALRSMMLISIENNKEESKRDFSDAYKEYETAKSMIRSSDDTSYLLQLESLIEQLKKNGWL